MIDLKGKVAVVFGLANKRSIAWGIAQKLSEAGATLAICYQNERLKKEADALIPELRDAKAYQCDVSVDAEIDSLFATLKETYGTLHTIVHAVAFAPADAIKNDFLLTTREDFRIAQDVSVYSLIAVSRAAVPLMTEGGSILTLTYYGSTKVFPNYNVMGVAKAGLEAAVRYLAASLGAKNIRVNAISAGPIKTLAARGIGDFSKEVAAWVDGIKAKSDIRIPIFVVYGDVDSAASTDATIPAGDVLQHAIDNVKKYNHISTKDRIETYNSGYTAPYDVLVPGAKVVRAGADNRYPQGRFKVYTYTSDDAKPLNLFSLTWVADLSHGGDAREALCLVPCGAGDGVLVDVQEPAVLDDRPTVDEGERDRGRRLKGTLLHPIFSLCFGRLFGPLLGALVALVLLGMPVVVQAVMPAACECMHEVSSAPQPCSEHSPTPCKGFAAACQGAMSCLSISSLPGQEISTAAWLEVSRVTYSGGNFIPYGRSAKPLLGPPITI